MSNPILVWTSEMPDDLVVAVASGKSGTGKTSIVASFAVLSNDIILADCNVDSPGLHLLLRPDIKKTHDFSGGKLASIITRRRNRTK